MRKTPMHKTMCGVIWRMSGKMKATIMTCRNPAGSDGKCWIHTPRRTDRLTLTGLDQPIKMPSVISDRQTRGEAAMPHLE
jgi:hypothetical protein